ncbi:transcriptional regulator [Bacillus sp. M6-12]|uniref:AIM24 family protein n=1 Tax=Bacillus sp. M6-12 TaxID=2054166 RepID=UPI000C75FFE2|nr:AIM24 family protein [Bacillus sp. M6-12]PLS19577.1 transcriptional regulator [Bacillus sp. M6-12]
MNPLFYENVKILDRIEKEKFTAEILEFKSLKGANDLDLAGEIFFARETGMSLKQVKITLRNGSFMTEAGALYFMKGRISAQTNVGGVGGLMKKAFKSYLNQESTFKPTYEGTGEIFLEPTFGHYVFFELDNESVIVDKGLFYACEPSLQVEPAMQGNLSSGLFGGEGWFQTKISGTGLCILEIPVPREEVLIYELNNEKLQVDGNFALLRTEGINFSVQKSSKTLVGTLASGEGLLQTFEGTGQVWLAPTQPVYKKLETYGVQALNKSKNISNDV